MVAAIATAEGNVGRKGGEGRGGEEGRLKKEIEIMSEKWFEMIINNGGFQGFI